MKRRIKESSRISRLKELKDKRQYKLNKYPIDRLTKLLHDYEQKYVPAIHEIMDTLKDIRNEFSGDKAILDRFVLSNYIDEGMIENSFTVLNIGNWNEEIDRTPTEWFCCGSNIASFKKFHTVDELIKYLIDNNTPNEINTICDGIQEELDDEFSNPVKVLEHLNKDIENIENMD